MLFDLDGTITDPASGITASIRHALVRLGLTGRSDEELRRCIGPPLQDGFASLGVPPDRIDEAIAGYREHYDGGALHDVELHDGIEALLARLIDDGRRLGVATSKPWVYAERILDELDLRDRFDVVAGAELDGTNRTKAAVVADALGRLGDPDPDDVVLIGDRHHDVEGASEHGVASIGVAWGFAEPGELAGAGAQHVTGDVDELARLLGVAEPADVPMRRAVRAVIADGADRVLLVHWIRPDVDLWMTPGGGVELGERTRSSLRRELGEEVGLHDAEIGPIVLTRSFLVRHAPTRWRGQRESWRLVRVDGFDPPPLTELPHAVEEGIVELRWWTLDELRAAPVDQIQHDAFEAIGDELTSPGPVRPVHTRPRG